VQLASDANKHLIEKPFVPGFRPAPLEGLGVGASEAQAPLTDGLVADHDAPPANINSTSRRLRLKQ